MSKFALKEEVVRVENLDDLCEIVRHNNNVFANRINAIDARSRSTRKALGWSFIGAAIAYVLIDVRFCNIEDRLKKHEERLGIVSTDKE